MSRYDWPHSTELLDEGDLRRAFNSILHPPPSFRLPDGSFPPVGDAPPVPPPVAASLWLPVGPSVVLGGQATGSPAVSGRVRDLAVEPTRGHRLYAATGSGGVWYSDSRGVSWEPLDGFASSPNRNTQTPVGNSLSCGAIHVEWGAAEDGSQDTVTVGTGEIYGTLGPGTPGATLSGVGVLRATGPATGARWSREAVGDTGDIDLRGHGFYRIVSDPGKPAVLLAATSVGLRARRGTVWESAQLDGRVVDVAITRHTAPARVRVWAARYSELFVAEAALTPASPVLDPTTLSYQSVRLPGVLNRTVGAKVHTTRLALCVGANPGDLWVVGRRNPPGSEDYEPAQAWHVDASMDLTSGTPIATEVTGVPPTLFGEKDQSGYDMAIAAHPTLDGQLWLGGATQFVGGSHNASLYDLVVARTTTGSTTSFEGTATWVGRGVHADVHSIRTAPSPGPGTAVSVWVGCDGGVFLSDRDGGADSWFARNTGLATLEAGFVASHPTNDGLLAAGMQDNGVCVRVGDTVWFEVFRGDGGSVVYDPTHVNRFISQYIRGRWHVHGSSSTPPVFRRALTKNNSQDLENNEAAFYSGADAVSHGGTVHLALGTNRVWYSDDWGSSWVTLPSGIDPREDLDADLAQDVLFHRTPGSPYTDSERGTSFLCCDTTDTESGTSTAGASILTVKWGTPRAEDGMDRIRLTVLVSEKGNSCVAIVEGHRASDSSGSWTWERPVRTLAIRAPASTSASERAAVDAGDATPFLPAPGLVNDLAVHDADRGSNGSFYVTTIGAPGSGAGQDIDTLWWYDGERKFWPTGTRRVFPSDGSGNARSHWIPSGARITAPAHAVLVDRANLDTVYVGTSVGVVRGTLDTSGLEPTWAWEPFNNNLPEAVVHDLSIHDHEGVRLLRAALAARGVWEVDLARDAKPRDYLRLFDTDTRRRLPTPLDGPTTNGATGILRWDASPDVIIDTSDLVHPGGPLEPTLYASLDTPRTGRRVSAVVATTEMRVHVLVHHRWHEPAQPADLRVALFRHLLADDDTAPADDLWAALVAISGGGTVPDPLPGNWLAAGASLVEPVAAAATARTPRAATFDVDLSDVGGLDVVLLAVVLSAADPLTAAETREGGAEATTVEQIVLRTRHAAARSVRAGSR